MKKKIDTLPVFFAAVLAVTMTAGVLLRTFLPAAVLPKLDIPAMALLVLAALLLEHYLGAGEKHCYGLLALWGALGFGLLPVAAGMVEVALWWKYALVGGAVLAGMTALFTSLTDRLLSGPAAKAAPIIGGVCLWLACQCFAGMIF